MVFLCVQKKSGVIRYDYIKMYKRKRLYEKNICSDDIVYIL